MLGLDSFNSQVRRVCNVRRHLYGTCVLSAELAIEGRMVLLQHARSVGSFGLGRQASHHCEALPPFLLPRGFVFSDGSVQLGDLELLNVLPLPP